MRWYPPQGVKRQDAFGDFVFDYYKIPGERDIRTKITARFK